MPPLVQKAEKLKIGSGRRPERLRLFLEFSFGCFVKKLRLFHDPVKIMPVLLDPGIEIGKILEKSQKNESVIILTKYYPIDLKLGQ